MFDTDQNLDFDVDEEFLSQVFLSYQEEIAAKQNSNEVFKKKPEIVEQCRNGINNISTIHITANACNKTKKRKFPGPAGLLPEYPDNFNLSVINENNPSEYQEFSPDCSQETNFASDSWTEMLKEFNGNLNFHEKYNINWIKTRSDTNTLYNHKAPFLAAIVTSLDCFETNSVTLNLKDPTGDIKAVMQHEFYVKHKEEIFDGSVLILGRFTVFTIGIGNHCIAIAPKNLITIYSPRKNAKKESEIESNVKISKVQCLSSRDFINVIRTYETVSRQAINKQSNNWRRTNKNTNDINQRPNKNSSQLRTNLKINHKKQKCSDFSCNQQNIFDDLEELDLVFNDAPNINSANDKHKEFNCTAMSESNENSQILSEIFDGVDTSLFFDDDF